MDLHILSTPASPSNYAIGRKGRQIDKIVVHVMEGSYVGSRNWFANSAAHASAHYLVSFAGEISQSVDDANTAWHAGNSLYNETSIGIELEGKTADQNFPDAMIQALAGLILHLAELYNIPIDRQHIIGHCEVPDPTHPGQFGGLNGHTDPGKFVWPQLMPMLMTPPVTTTQAANT